jgi:hypothetical protein
VNFEAPHRATPLGFDTMDWTLDLTVSPAYACERKDAEAFERELSVGRFPVEVGEQAFAAAAEMEARVAERLFPFDDVAMAWRPGADWPVPRLPLGWERLPSGDVLAPDG